MKSLKKTLLVAVCALSFASCSQQSEITPTQEAKKTNTNVIEGRGREWGDDGTYPGIEGMNYGCFTPPGQCSDYDIIIMKPKLSGVLKTIHSVQSQIVSEFTANRAMLIQHFPVVTIDGVINGDLLVSLRGEPTDSKCYMLFRDSATNDLNEVYPIVQQ